MGEVALRILILLGAALLFTPFAFDTSGMQTVGSLLCGLALIALSLRRGRVAAQYAGWNRYII